MKKRGQVTIFIIIGILLVAGTASVVYLKNAGYIQNPESNSDPIYNSIYSCLEETGDGAIIVTLSQGGTYESGNFNNFQIYKLAKPVDTNVRAIEKNEDYSFSKQHIEQSIENYFDDTFEPCLEAINFSQFGKDVEIEAYELDVEAYDKFIFMSVEMPVTIKHANETSYLEEFKYTKKLNVDYMIDVINKIVDESVENNFPPYETIDELEKDYNVDIYTQFVFEETAIENIIYSATFNKDKIVVNFNVNYNWYKK